jgi:hypothetical protein
MHRMRPNPDVLTANETGMSFVEDESESDFSLCGHESVSLSAHCWAPGSRDHATVLRGCHLGEPA